jgi:Fur family zinc uptake transcriptional regulator
MSPNISAAQRRAILGAAEDACERNGARLTPLRRRALELVLASDKPVGAYSLLRALREDGYGDAPPTVYRTLEFLQAQGLVHRIAKSNAYMACRRPRAGHFGLVFVCTRCGDAVEIDDERVVKDISRCAGAVYFRVPGQVFEVEGICGTCNEGT